MLNGVDNNFDLDRDNVYHQSNFKNNTKSINLKGYRRTLSSDAYPPQRPIPLDYKLVATRTRVLQSTVVDLRPQRTVHVTNCCRQLCGATHCGLSTVLPLYDINNYNFSNDRIVEIPIQYQKPPIKQQLSDTNSLQIVKNANSKVAVDSASSSLQSALDSLDQLINEALGGRPPTQEEMEGRSSSQWKTSFESTRLLFKNDVNRPQTIKLGGINATSTNSIDIFVENHDSPNESETPPHLHTPTTLSPKSRVYRSRSTHSMDSGLGGLTNGALDDAYGNNNNNSLTVNHNGDRMSSHSRSKSPVSSLMSDFWLNSLAQPKLDFVNKTSGINVNVENTKSGSTTRLKILEENQSRFDKLFESFVSVAAAATQRKSSSPSPASKSSFMTKSKSEDVPLIAALTNGDGSSSRPMSFSELDSIIEDLKATGKQLEQLDNGKRNFYSQGVDGELHKLIQTTVASSSSVAATLAISATTSQSPLSDSRISSKSPDDLDSVSHHAQLTVHTSHHHHQHHSPRQKAHHSGQAIKEMFQVDSKFPRSNIWRSLATGAVAERVQQFDKTLSSHLKVVENAIKAPPTAPEVLDSLRNALAEASGQLSPSPSNLVAQQKSASVSVVLPSTSSSAISTSVVSTRPAESKKRSVVTKSAQQQQPSLPKFHFPYGRPPCSTDDSESVLQKVGALFETFPNSRAKANDMAAVCKACDMSQYLKKHLFAACGGRTKGSLTFQEFSKFWKKFSAEFTTDAAKFVKLVSSNVGNCLVADDFIPIIQDIVDTHVGLSFLREAPEFHSRYVHTVVARIFYTVNRSWSGKITITELMKSNFIQTLKKLDDIEDINLIMDYFSYEHFYVIYCKFWELDRDHDLLIDKDDLSRHNDYAISNRMIDRIFSGAVTKGGAPKNGKMTYTDYVWFLLSEEDKRNATSMEYWFRCMDIDGDGVLSMYELEYFYEEQARKLELTGVEPMPFLDVMCQMLDIVKPKRPDRITLNDLKRCKMSPIFFDTFFNMEKYLEHEQRESGGVAARIDYNDSLTDWERYAAEEYDALVAEEQGAGETEIHCDDSDEDFNGQALSKSAPENDLKSALSNKSYL